MDEAAHFVARQTASKPQSPCGTALTPSKAQFGEHTRIVIGLDTVWYVGAVR